MKLAIASALIIGMALIILLHLVLIAIYGQVIIQEPNSVALVVDITFFFGALLFGVYLLAEAIKEVRRR